MKPDTEPIPLTPPALARMKARLANLKASLPALAAEAERTAAYGDRSDNAEYKEAKGLLRRAHRQIFAIEDQLKRIVLIPEGPNATGRVELGCTVIVQSVDESGVGARRTFQILGPHETRPEAGRISHVSPLGSALMGHAKDDIVTVTTADGERQWRIVEIR